MFRNQGFGLHQIPCLLICFVTLCVVIVGMLTAKAGPHTGSHSGLIVPDPWERHVVHEQMKHEWMYGWTH